MADSRIHPVVLSGGSGNRLWPLSRRAYPKQFLPLTGEATLFQSTAERVVGPAFHPVTVVASEEHRFVVAEQLRDRGLPWRRLIIEPVARNTAIAVAVATLSIASADPDAVLLVLPSDHQVRDRAAFLEAVAEAKAAAGKQRLLTFGIRPLRAETGYGYIELGRPISENACAIQRFTEKPDAETAERFLAGGRHLWNSGIFLLPAAATLVAFEQLAPAVLAAARAALAAASSDLDFLRLDRASLEQAPNVSFDVAIMEKVADAGVVPCEMGWSDVGAWDQLWLGGDKDAAGNVALGKVVAEDARDSYLRAESRLLAAVGVEDLVVVETDTAVLVARRDRAQDVKSLVERLQREGHPEASENAKSYRPWGWYRSIALGPRYQVKQIGVKPGHSLSLQMHRHRAEHWIIVQGTALATRGEDVRLVRENESIYISAGEKHRLENPGKVELELIEVQTGTYFGEDDIVRFTDNYGRS
ncbi:MAG TPA: mannose-1-phosphate guanylyltransferase/mannose-6-phosphate isomerase [Kiloniellales bacterium]|nr:mannose-1-phosphate guanylyltransferase/mannose-6-phosphate isomerase [Kiloniellales bacterium]